MLRERLTYANVVATICLFLVLGGGAYAATQLPANSVGTKQLKDEAVTSRKLSKQAFRKIKRELTKIVVRQPGQYKVGPSGPQGPRGATGPQGPAQLGGVIPSGTTVVGDWNITDAFEPEYAVQEAVALPGKTPIPLTDEDVNFGFEDAGVAADEDEACTGNATAPTAPPGKVCIYANYAFFSINALSGETLRLNPESPVSLVAFTISTGKPGNNGHAGGTWAYTAP